MILLPTLIITTIDNIGYVFEEIKVRQTIHLFENNIA